MRKKMLITIALIVVMLLNCIAPVIQVQAATEKTTITFNRVLYNGLKSYFQEKNIKATYNDGLRTIKIDNSTISEIKELSLKEKGISDISGLEVFTGLESLILSGNDLDEKSNLQILNSFTNLKYLDLSSNQISDISSIQSLLENLIKSDPHSVNLTGQIVKKVVDVPLSLEDQEEKVTYSLPQILQITGIAENGEIKNKGLLKSDWISERNYIPGSKCFESSTEGTYKVENTLMLYPYIINSSISNPVLSDNNNFDIKVGDENNGIFYQYNGLVKWVINIKDKSTVSYNINPAAENILKDSTFTLYYVVHSNDTEGVIFKDNNLYNAIKEQLTKGQIVNSELLSYKYSTEQNDDIYYDFCDVELSGKTATLKINDQIVYVIDDFNAAGYDGNAVIKDSDGQIYEIQDYEVEYVDSYNNTGVLTRVLKVKVPHYNEECRNLYEDYYDEPYALVISDADIINKITSLILNDKRIQDLYGLEKFVGLESNLNISYNYIDTLATIYGLQLNKDTVTSDIQQQFSDRRSAMASKKTDLISAYESSKSVLESIKTEIEKSEKAIRESEALEVPSGDSEEETKKYNEAIDKYKADVKAANEAIKGDGTNEKPGLISELKDALANLNKNLPAMNDRLKVMYDTFNNEYKLTSLLIPELNYQTEEEYEEFKEKYNDKDKAKALAKTQVSRIATLEGAGALSDFEKELFESGFGITEPEDNKENYISSALNDKIKDLEETNAPKISWTSIIDTMIEIDIYAQAKNYCLIKRMNNKTAIGECYVEEYLAKRIKELDYEEINTSLIRAIYEKLVNGTYSTKYKEALYNTFVDYIDNSIAFEDGTSYFCEDKYYDVNSLSYNMEEDTSALLGDYVKDIYLVEKLDSIGNQVDWYNFDNLVDFFEQLLALANKFTAVDEISRYVVLPNLKKLDVRNNEIETLGDTLVTMTDNEGNEVTTTENLITLKNLKELFAGHNFVTGDITCVDWTKLTTLKKLDLSYNFITDIQPLQNLKNLRYLDVSDNLLEGAFNVSLKAMPKLKDINLSGNKYTDIIKILQDYELEAQGDFTKYFAREDTLNIDLSRQNVEIDISDAIAYQDNNSVYEVELPPIFAQLEFIDATRTAFGTTSSKGTITAKGGVAYVPVLKPGEYVGLVKVIAANGYPEDVTTSFGIDSTCTIKYNVKNIIVNSVKINGDTTRMEVGTSRVFDATVNGTDVPDTTVEWNIEGVFPEDTTTTEGETTEKALSQDTKFELITDEQDENYGKMKLTIGDDEIATEIKITATSNYDNTKEDTVNFEVYRKVVTDISISGPEELVVGKNGEYTAEVIGTDIIKDEDKLVDWSVENKTSNDTKVEIIKAEEGKEVENVGGAKLTIGADETAEKVTLVAETKDKKFRKTFEVTVGQKEISKIKIIGDDHIRTGNSAIYTVEVTDNGNLDEEDKAVIWNIVDPRYERYYNPNTKLEVIEAEEGKEVENVGGAKFTVAPEEEVETFVIEAMSAINGEICDRKTITIDKKSVSEVNITSGDDAIVTGKSSIYTAEVKGEFLDEEDKEVTWDIEGLDSQGNTVAVKEGTKLESIVAEEGKEVENVGGAKLTIANDETASKIKVIAKSKFYNNELSDEQKRKESSIKEVTINKKEVSNVRVYDQNVTLVLDKTGKSNQFAAIVEGKYLDPEDKKVTWEIEGKQSEFTEITENGLLVIHQDETAEQLTIIAKSTFDNTKIGTATVTIERKGIKNIELTSETQNYIPGTTVQFNANVTGDYEEDANIELTWLVEGKNSNNTTISEDGLLTIAEDETARELIVKVEAKYGIQTLSKEKQITISTKKVRSVTITEQSVRVQKGGNHQFTAVVEGDNLEEEDKTIEWNIIENPGHRNTGIHRDGKLEVAAGETLNTLTVKATSKLDTSISGTAVVTIVDEPVEPVLPQLGYEVDSDGDLIGISPDTTSSNFKTKLLNDNTYTIKVTRKGQEISNTTSVATGDIVTILKDGEVIDSLEIVVKGDVNGDGTVDVSDSNLVKGHRNRQVELTGLFYKAADLNKNGEIDISDIKLILAHRAMMDGYIL